jgi:hypothetical protein
VPDLRGHACFGAIHLDVCESCLRGGDGFGQAGSVGPIGVGLEVPPAALDVLFGLAHGTSGGVVLAGGGTGGMSGLAAWTCTASGAFAAAAQDCGAGDKNQGDGCCGRQRGSRVLIGHDGYPSCRSLSRAAGRPAQ